MKSLALLDGVQMCRWTAQLIVFSAGINAAFSTGCSNGQGTAVAQAAVAQTSEAQTSEVRRLLPIPEGDEIKKANDLVAEVYKEDFSATKSRADKQRVAKKLLQAGQDTKDDPLGRFVLLRTGMDLASQAGDYSTAAKAIDELASTHAVDGLELKCASLEIVSKTVRLPKQHEAFCGEIVPLVQTACSANRYSHAKQLAALLVRSAKAARSPKLASGATNLSAEVDEQATEYEKLSESLKKVEAHTAAASDKLAVGSFHCFVKGDFKNGLPLLSEGSDEPLSQIAADELSGPVEADDQLKLADAWWSYAERSEAGRANRLRLHAAAWYERAQPKLTGLSAARSKQRIELAQKGNLDRVAKLDTPPPESRREAEAIDLLAVLRQQRPSMTGVGFWKDTKTGISLQKAAYNRVPLPFPIDGNGYDLLVEFEQSGGDECITLLLPIENRMTVLMLDGWHGRGYRTYLCNVKGLEACDNSDALRGKHLERGKTHLCHVDASWDSKTEKAHVVVALDDRELFSWEGRITDLSPQNGWDLRMQRVVGIGCYETPTLFKKAELIPK